MSAILKQQKRKHSKIVIDPFKFTTPVRPASPSFSSYTSTTPSVASVTGLVAQSGAAQNVIHPGERPDNAWLQYTREAYPRTQEAFDQIVYVDKTHWGYYTWPRYPTSLYKT